MTYGIAVYPVSNNRALTQGHTPIKSPIPVHTSVPTYNEILRMFPYLEDKRHSLGHGVPPFTWHPFNESESFTLPSCGNIEVIPLPVQHGKDHAPIPQPYTCIGFRIGDFSYLSDVSFVPEKTRRKIEGTKVLILNALREKPQSAHFSFSEVFHFYNRLISGERIRQVAGVNSRDHIFDWNVTRY
jgi:phosphoribosyl 1,2-cyclic phosphodiesterase